MQVLNVKRIFRPGSTNMPLKGTREARRRFLLCCGSEIPPGECTETGPSASSKRIRARTDPAILDTAGGHGLTVFMDASELAITARMARLSLTREELQKLGVAVEQMLQHFSHMKEIDTEGLAPTTHPLLRENRLREDAESALAPSDTLLDSAPEREERFIVIPNVL
jgi:aspartyl-tRNA(Asn)/glutamyl-tRNA(Gln) amidotransferase subunit C